MSELEVEVFDLNENDLDVLIHLRYDEPNEALPNTAHQADNLLMKILYKHITDIIEGEMMITVVCLNAKKWPLRVMDEIKYHIRANDREVELISIRYASNCDPVVINKNNNKFSLRCPDTGTLLVAKTDQLEFIMPYTESNYTIRVYGDEIQDLAKKYPDDSGYDLRAISDGVIYAGQVETLSLGVSILFPKGYELQMRPRSGMTKDDKVTVFGGVGTIDYGYTGHVGVTLINGSDKAWHYKRGDRIAQCVLAPVITDCPVLICKGKPPKSGSERANQGFGHSGKD